MVNTCLEGTDRFRQESPIDQTAYSSATSTETARIAIIDDEPTNVKVLRKHLKDRGYVNFTTTSDATEAFGLIKSDSPDVILLDVVMPGTSGLEILERVRGDKDTARTPVLMLTASEDPAIRREALELGATDYLIKPIDPCELTLRVANSLVLKAHHDYLVHNTEFLQREVEKRTRQLSLSRLEIIYRLARAAEYRDNETGRHVIRVGRYAEIIAGALGMDSETATMIGHAAPLHDVGKIGIPDSILLKPGKLTPEEFEFMQSHCAMGKRVFERLSDNEILAYKNHADIGSELLGGSTSPLLQMAARIAVSHHERWDGSGYPLALAGEDIPIEGRITAAADVFDALSSKRPYKPAFPLKKCFEIMEEGRGSHFDPRILDAFFASRQEIVAVQIEYADVN